MSSIPVTILFFFWESWLSIVWIALTGKNAMDFEKSCVSHSEAGYREYSDGTEIYASFQEEKPMKSNLQFSGISLDLKIY